MSTQAANCDGWQPPSATTWGGMIGPNDRTETFETWPEAMEFASDLSPWESKPRVTRVVTVFGSRWAVKWRPRVYTWNLPCTCGQAWHSILPPPPCPTHGRGWAPRVTWSR